MTFEEFLRGLPPYTSRYDGNKMQAATWNTPDLYLCVKRLPSGRWYVSGRNKETLFKTREQEEIKAFVARFLYFSTRSLKGE